MQTRAATVAATSISTLTRYIDDPAAEAKEENDRKNSLAGDATLTQPGASGIGGTRRREVRLRRTLTLVQCLELPHRFARVNLPGAANLETVRFVHFFPVSNPAG
jgi:hypothetical protein